MDEHQVHMLQRGRGADPVYSSSAYPRFSGTAPAGDDPNKSKNILVMGGFPALQADSSAPLSPTLQLNGDLTLKTKNQLAAIGRAELIRSNNQSFRSYIVEADSGVAVLAGDETSLDTFLDSYGGVLRIEPLLVKGFSPDFVTAEDLNIVCGNEGCLLSFMVRQPVDPEHCTYCGACGRVCPEHCISEKLYLDFSRCTFCKECIAACSSHNAIDLHGREQRELQVPAILILGDTEVPLPDNTTKIYRENDLAAFFASISAVRVEEVVSWDGKICQYSRKLEKGCNICLSSCKHGALSQERDGIHIDHLQCIECGACLASCPTGALQYSRFDDRRFVEYFRTVKIESGSTVVLGSEKDLHQFWWHTARRKHENTFFFEYPQPMALSSMHFFFLFALGAGRIVIMGDQEKSRAVRMQGDLVTSVIEALFPGMHPVQFADSDSLGAALLEPVEAIPLNTFYRNFSFTNRREKLADLLAFLLSLSTSESLVPTNIATENFGEIICDTHKCTLCNACVGECRIGSLYAKRDNFTLMHLPALCIQCGSCVELCPENALSAKPGIVLQDNFFVGKKMAQADPVTCLECGKVFGTRQSLDRVMALLTAKNLWDGKDNLLSYCDNCRVVKLYESGVEKK